MKKSFKFDPMAHKDFEKIEGDNKPHYNTRIDNLDISDIKIAVELYQKYQETGVWPVTGTIMHTIHNEYFEPMGIGEWEGVLIVYDSICHKIAEMWYSKELDIEDK